MNEPPDDIWDARLSPEEFAEREAAARASASGPEGEELRAYHAWFVRRYPTPLERLAYCRRKYREAMSIRGGGRAEPG